MVRENSPLRVALLNVSHMPAATETNFRKQFDGIDRVDFTAYDTRNLDLPELDAIDAAVVTGSIDSVNDDYEYVDATREWLQNADMPIFGVCFGHQLVATAFGGEVEHMPKRELGYRRITLDRPTDPLFEGISEDPVVFLCHEDTVVEPPPGATILASNEYGIQAFRLGQTVAVQYHPEVDENHARRLLTELDLPDAVRRNALETVTEKNTKSAHQLRRLFENFIADLSDQHNQNNQG